MSSYFSLEFFDQLAAPAPLNPCATSFEPRNKNWLESDSADSGIDGEANIYEHGTETGNGNVSGNCRDSGRIYGADNDVFSSTSLGQVNVNNNCKVTEASNKINCNVNDQISSNINRNANSFIRSKDNRKVNAQSSEAGRDGSHVSSRRGADVFHVPNPTANSGLKAYVNNRFVPVSRRDAQLLELMAPQRPLPQEMKPACAYCFTRSLSFCWHPFKDNEGRIICPLISYKLGYLEQYRRSHPAYREMRAVHRRLCTSLSTSREAECGVKTQPNASGTSSRLHANGKSKGQRHHSVDCEAERQSLETEYYKALKISELKFHTKSVEQIMDYMPISERIASRSYKIPTLFTTQSETDRKHLLMVDSNTVGGPASASLPHCNRLVDIDQRTTTRTENEDGVHEVDGQFEQVVKDILTNDDINLLPVTCKISRPASSNNTAHDASHYSAILTYMMPKDKLPAVFQDQPYLYRLVRKAYGFKVTRRCMTGDQNETGAMLMHIEQVICERLVEESVRDLSSGSLLSIMKALLMFETRKNDVINYLQVQRTEFPLKFLLNYILTMINHYNECHCDSTLQRTNYWSDLNMIYSWATQNYGRFLCDAEEVIQRCDHFATDPRQEAKINQFKSMDWMDESSKEQDSEVVLPDQVPAELLTYCMLSSSLKKITNKVMETISETGNTNSVQIDENDEALLNTIMARDMLSRPSCEKDSNSHNELISDPGESNCLDVTSTSVSFNSLSLNQGSFQSETCEGGEHLSTLPYDLIQTMNVYGLKAFTECSLKDRDFTTVGGKLHLKKLLFSLVLQVKLFCYFLDNYEPIVQNWNRNSVLGKTAHLVLDRPCTNKDLYLTLNEMEKRINEPKEKAEIEWLGENEKFIEKMRQIWSTYERKLYSLWG